MDNPYTQYEKQWHNFPARFEANCDRILKFVNESNTKGTFFCLGWIVKKYPNTIRKIADLGYEIACHSHSHQLAYKQSPSEFRDDLLSAKNLIEDTIGKPIDTYRIPGFSLTNESLWAIDILVEEGIKVDCSIFPAFRGHGGIPNFKNISPCILKTKMGNRIKEFPLNAYSFLGNRFIFSGGGYFRLFPYWFLKYLFLKSTYVMTYFHPRDFDPGQPKINGLSTYRKFKCYYGLNNSEKKIIKLLNDFKFSDVRTANSIVCWSQVPEIEIN